MVIGHWSEYIIDQNEHFWYHFWQQRAREFIAAKARTNFRQLGFFERYLKDVRIMAKQAKSKRTGSPVGDAAIRWINLPITEDLHQACEEWMDSQFTDLMGYCGNIAERGFGVSLKPGRDNDFQCTIFGAVDNGNSKQTIGVSGYALSPIDAIAVCLFKFIVLLEWGTNIPEEQPRTSRSFR